MAKQDNVRIFDVKKAPVALEMVFEPKLVKDARPVRLRFIRGTDKGEPCYIGTAVNDWGYHVGGGCIIVHQDLRDPVGGRAFSHILSGGNRRRALGPKKSRAERRRLAIELWHALIYLQDAEAHDEVEALTAVLTAAFQFDVEVEKKPLTEEDLDVIALLGAPLWAVESLQELGYRVIIDPKAVAMKYTRSHVTQVTDGGWDDIATSVAYTHTVPYGVVRFLKEKGVRYGLTRYAG